MSFFFLLVFLAEKWGGGDLLPFLGVCTTWVEWLKGWLALFLFLCKDKKSTEQIGVLIRFNKTNIQ